MPKSRKSGAYKSARKIRKLSSGAIVPMDIAMGTSRPVFVRRSYGNPKAITERKYFDTEVNGTALVGPSTSWAGGELDNGTLLTLFAPVTGDDYLNRTGRKVQVLSIKIRGEINCLAQINQSAADSAMKIRLCLVQDKQTNGGQLNAEDVINSGAASVAQDMFQNPAFFGRFKVLKDKSWTIQNPSLSYDGTNLEQSGLMKHFQWTVKFRKPVVVHFNATNGGTVADIIDNSFHIIGIANSITGFAPAISYKCRTTFLDL